MKRGLKPLFGSGDRVQTSFCWVKIWHSVPEWPWKWGQGHKKLITSFSCPNGVSVQVWSKSTYRFRRQSADKAHFCSLYIVWWPWKLSQGHQNLINSIHYPNDTIHKVWQNPSFGSRDRVQTSRFWSKLTFKELVWPWKWGQRHQNLITSFPCPNGVYVQVWSKSTFWFGR